MINKSLTASDYQNAAAKLRCEVSDIMALFSVEALGQGFINGQMKILFERHWFRKFTGGKFDGTHPQISNRMPGGYRGGAAEWQRFNEAAALDRHAALLSISMGSPQIMGFNHIKAGFPSVEIMFAEMQKGEPEQLNAFVNFIIKSGLDDELREEDYQGLADIYNGPGNAKNNYAPRMAAADHKFEAQGVDKVKTIVESIASFPQSNYAPDASVAIPPPPPTAIAPEVESKQQVSKYSIDDLTKRVESASTTVTKVSNIAGKASDSVKSFRTLASMASFGSVLVAIGGWFKENPLLSSLIFVGILIIALFAWKYMTRQEKIGVARVQNQ